MKLLERLRNSKGTVDTKVKCLEFGKKHDKLLQKLCEFPLPSRSTSVMKESVSRDSS